MGKAKNFEHAALQNLPALHFFHACQFSSTCLEWSKGRA